jgi:hemerythrin
MTSTQSLLLTWSDEFNLGYTPMDETHEEFVEIVGRMQQACEGDLPGLLAEMLAHAQVHFELENTWMRETGFPPRDCHIQEHDAVLASMREVAALMEQGNLQVCRGLVDALADWFPGHATHLDSALAHWMFKRQHGGKPVVLRRRVGGDE